MSPETVLLFVFLWSPLILAQSKTTTKPLALPELEFCLDRVRHGTYRDTRDIEHAYFFSWRYNVTKDQEVTWEDARNICRRHCMDTVSLETVAENDFIKGEMAKDNVRFIWTSGRKCDFPGCDRPEYQPLIENGWLWTGSGTRIGRTTNRITGDWSHTGLEGKPQPDNRASAYGGDEGCLTILNNFYNDGIKWHDISCDYRKPYVCEDSDELLAYVRARNPGTKL